MGLQRGRRASEAEPPVLTHPSRRPGPLPLPSQTECTPDVLQHQQRYARLTSSDTALVTTRAFSGSLLLHAPLLPQQEVAVAVTFDVVQAPSSFCLPVMQKRPWEPPFQARPAAAPPVSSAIQAAAAPPPRLPGAAAPSPAPLRHAPAASRPPPPMQQQQQHLVPVAAAGRGPPSRPGPLPPAPPAPGPFSRRHLTPVGTCLLSSTPRRCA